MLLNYHKSLLKILKILKFLKIWFKVIVISMHKIHHLKIIIILKVYIFVFNIFRWIVIIEKRKKSDYF